MANSPAVMSTYARVDLAFDRGEGPWLVTTDGRRFLDFTSGIAVTALGHAHPHLVAALTDQAGRLWHCSNLFEIPGQTRLAERLCAASFAESVFFTNSGAEAIEAALKMARRHHSMGGGTPGRWRVLVTEGAFHGRTLATLSAGGQPKHTEGFAPLVEGFDRVPYGDLEAARAAVSDQTAAILVEPIQGEGGINPPPDGYLRGLRALADETGCLLILDEIQTGIGRTGTLFAHEAEGIVPDIMAIAKGLGGGFPMGACLARTTVARALTPGSHGTTFGGNPLAMAVGNAVLDVLLAPETLPRVRRVAEDLRGRLETLVTTHPAVLKGLRGRGLMLGLVCHCPNTALLDALREEGLLAVPAAGNVVRLLPPLIIDAPEVDRAMEALERACARLAGEES